VKVLVVNNTAPFVWGGAEELAEHLRRNLVAFGHRAEVVRVPFQWEPARVIPGQMLLAHTIEVANVDHVIALKFPAYLVRHPSKTLWLLHQYRQAYDLFDAGQTNLPEGVEGEQIRELIRGADQECFNACRAIYTNSEVTSDRLLKYNGFASTVLRPPVNDPDLFSGGEYGNYIFCGGRINLMKRQHLLMEALAASHPNVRLVIAGPADSVADQQRIERLVEELGVSDRVTLDVRMLSRREYADYVNGALAVAYIPFDEDSLGYVAMEAATAAKPLITTVDSGGVLRMIVDDSTGWSAPATADGLAVAFSAAFESVERARSYGENLREHWQGFGSNWERVVEALLP
jgi:glycosyltransferase involved in cell wall biosynthesis